MSLLELLQSANPEKQSLILDAIRTERVAEARLLSYGQKRLWFLYLLEPNSPAYNIALSLRLRGALDVEALQSGLDEVVKRHAILRTKFVTVGNEPVQVVEERSCFSIERGDLSGWTEGEREAEVLRLAEEEGRKGFDLSRGPLLRARLLRLGEEEHVLLITMHHIVSDGWSMGVLVQELNALYGGYVAGKEVKLPELEIQYADYAYWQRQWLQGEVLEEQLGYWREKLEGVARLELPTDGARPATVSYEGGSVSLELSEEASAGLKELSRENGATLFMGLLAGFVVLLSRYSGQEDIAVGTDVANRTWKETESLVGFFVNQLVLRTDVSGDPSFRELLGRVREVCLGAYTHQDLPFEKLVEELSPERDLSRTPLFQVKLTLENTPLVTGCFEQLNIEFLDIDQTSAKVDLQLHITEQGGGLQLHWIYRKDLFEAETIERMMGHYERVLKAAIGEPGRRISELEMLGEEERRRLLVEWNDTAREYGGEGTVHEMFEAQAERTPEAVALVCGEEELSYGELNRRANQVAHYLRELGVGPEVLVGVYLERSIGMVVGILGVLKAGGAYVPLDPEHPQRRIENLASDAAVKVIITKSEHSLSFSSYSGAFLNLDVDGNAIRQESCESLEIDVQEGNAAYVIYTSGSTGVPKGVLNTHKGVLNRLLWMQDQYQLTPEDRVLQKTPYTFDVSVWELLWPLISGAQLVIARPDGHKQPDYLIELIQTRGISVLHFVPSMLEALLENNNLRACTTVREVFVSGEALSPELQRRFFQMGHGRLHNLYGPTEAAIDVTAWECISDWHGTSVPIGRPITNAEIYILDGNLSPVPIGVRGELHIAGVPLARGYLNKGGMTAEKFVPNPFNGPGSRLYKTGDIARYTREGNVEYVGRSDHQVKLRGFRIELGEIEEVLRQNPAVAQAAVILREDEPGDRKLVAYWTSRDELRSSDEVSDIGLREFLRNRVPEYMVPAAFVRMSKLPTTDTGKLDRRALPQPRPDVRSDIWSWPSNEIEEAICSAWKEVLGVEQVSIDENFFDLGGNSLLLIKLHHKLHLCLATEFPVVELFRYPTIRSFGEFALSVRGTAIASRVAMEGTVRGRERIQRQRLARSRFS